MARAQDPQVAIRRLNLVGLALLVLFFGVASAWAVTISRCGDSVRNNRRRVGC
jgi:hypothetical protein